MKPVAIIFALFVLLGVESVRADPTCNAAENLVSVATNAAMRVTFPQEGQLVTVKDFQVLMSFEGDIEAARLNHVHVQLDRGENATTPDLSGVFSLHNVADGEHTLLMYMATPEHVAINGKQTIHFRVSTTGINVFSPRNAAIVRSSDLLIRYGALGPVPDDFTHYAFQLDDRSILNEEVADGSFTIPGIADGPHQLTAWMAGAGDLVFGLAQQRSFEIRSDLNLENAELSLIQLKKFLRTSSEIVAKRSKNQALSLLRKMKQGGSVNPAAPGLTNKIVKRSLRLLQSAEFEDKAPARDAARVLSNAIS